MGSCRPSHALRRQTRLVTGPLRARVPRLLLLLLPCLLLLSIASLWLLGRSALLPLSSASSSSLSLLSPIPSACLSSPPPPLTLLTLDDRAVRLFSSSLPAPPYLLLLQSPFSSSAALFRHLPQLLSSLTQAVSVLVLSYGRSTAAEPTTGATHLRELYAIAASLPPPDTQPGLPSLRVISSSPLSSSAGWLRDLLTACPRSAAASLPALPAVLLLRLLSFNQTVDHVRLWPLAPASSALQLPAFTSLPPSARFRLLHVADACSASALPESPSPFLLLTSASPHCSLHAQLNLAAAIGASGLLLGSASAEQPPPFDSPLCSPPAGCLPGPWLRLPAAGLSWQDAFMLQDMALDEAGLSIAVGEETIGPTVVAWDSSGRGWWAAGAEPQHSPTAEPLLLSELRTVLLQQS